MENAVQCAFATKWAPLCIRCKRSQRTVLQWLKMCGIHLVSCLCFPQPSMAFKLVFFLDMGFVFNYLRKRRPHASTHFILVICVVINFCHGLVLIEHAVIFPNFKTWTSFQDEKQFLLYRRPEFGVLLFY